MVSFSGTLRVDYRAWESETDDGRLVPDQNVLPVQGLSNLEVSVYSEQLPVEGAATPTTYNFDKIEFTWPPEAAAERLYRLWASFVNGSQYPTSVSQEDDCSLVVSSDDVHTQELFKPLGVARFVPGEWGTRVLTKNDHVAVAGRGEEKEASLVAFIVARANPGALDV